MSASEVSKIIKMNNVKEVVLQFADVSGVLHSLWVPSEFFTKVAEEGIHMGSIDRPTAALDSWGMGG